jgi:hypothetical protein
MENKKMGRKERSKLEEYEEREFWATIARIKLKRATVSNFFVNLV